MFKTRNLSYFLEWCTWKVVGGNSLELEKLHYLILDHEEQLIRPNMLKFCMPLKTSHEIASIGMRNVPNF